MSTIDHRAEFAECETLLVRLACIVYEAQALTVSELGEQFGVGAGLLRDRAARMSEGDRRLAHRVSVDTVSRSVQRGALARVAGAAAAVVPAWRRYRDGANAQRRAALDEVVEELADLLEETDMFVCAECGSENVEIKAWVKPNAGDGDGLGEVVRYCDEDDNAGSDYCADCDDFVDVVNDSEDDDEDEDEDEDE
ncbi:MAG: hypothetical protein ABIJ09_02420 [Pseudomonadota bacterium]